MDQSSSSRGYSLVHHALLCVGGSINKEKTFLHTVHSVQCNKVGNDIGNRITVNRETACSAICVCLSFIHPKSNFRQKPVELSVSTSLTCVLF